MRKRYKSSDAFRKPLRPIVSRRRVGEEEHDDPENQFRL